MGSSGGFGFCVRVLGFRISDLEPCDYEQVL